MKTKKQWQESGKVFTAFAQVGDIVDDEIYYYFLGVVSPFYSSNKLFQCGEPYGYDYKEKAETFITFIKERSANWIYCGCITHNEAKRLLKELELI